MPRVSRYALPTHQTRQLFSYFSYLISSLHDERQIESFLSEFLTTEEKDMLTKRLAIFLLLEQNIPSSSIRAILNVSKETVRTYHSQFPLKSKLFHREISQIVRADNVKKFFKNSSKVLHTIVTAKTNMKSRHTIITPH